MKKTILKDKLKEAMKDEVFFETDKVGEHKVIRKVKRAWVDKDGKIQKEYGAIVRYLKTPSAWYKSKMERIKKMFQKQLKERQEKEAREKLIKQKMQELAIAELEKEGILYLQIGK